ncbi:MAG: D-alanyl-D-alanine carboxypeptidase family protein [Micromonosporaceae bacterium]
MGRLVVATAVALIAGLTVPPSLGPTVGRAVASPVGVCATAKATVSRTPPPPPPTPSHDPEWQAIGGRALATDGMALPKGATPAPKGLTARSWLVADLDSGAVLGGCGPHAYGAPASVQKLLLVATVLGTLDPDQVVRVTRGDLQFEPGSSAVGLVPNGRYSVETLWLGLLLVSGNDAANVLARLGGGQDGVAGTMRAMNAKAEHLGAYQTHAATPSGLDGPGQLTSAYDLALIARACFAREDFSRYAATERAKIPAQPKRKGQRKYSGYQIQNDNQLLFNYRGAIGGKTGFTDLARHTYVGAAERDGRRLVVTVLGAERQPLPGWEQGAKLLDWGFRQPRDPSVGRLVEPGETSRVATSPTPRGGGKRQAGAGTDSGGIPWWLVLVALVSVILVVCAGLVMVSRRRRVRRGG